MLAALQTQHGAPREVIKVREVESAKVPSTGEVRVRVLAAPIDPMDMLMARGYYPLLPGLPTTPGAEGVARVETLGPQVEGLAVGDHVLLPIRVGAWRDELTLVADDLVVVPSDLDPVQACMLRVNALSAHALLHESALRDGEWLIQSPGGGGVGQYVIQLARNASIRTLNVVSDATAYSFLEAIGADEIVELDRLGKRSGNSRPRVAFDGTGGKTTSGLARCLVDGSSIVCYGAISRQAGRLGVDQSVFRDIRLRGFWLHRWSREQGRDKVHSALRCLASAGLQNRVVASYPLQALDEALAHAEARPRGRVVLTMG